MRAGLWGHSGRCVPAAEEGDAGKAGGAREVLAGGQSADEPSVHSGGDGRELRQLEDDRDASLLQVRAFACAASCCRNWTGLNLALGFIIEFFLSDCLFSLWRRFLRFCCLSRIFHTVSCNGQWKLLLLLDRRKIQMPISKSKTLHGKKIKNKMTTWREQ